MNKTKNDEAWEWLLEQYPIEREISEKGKFVISSEQINKRREARLMTKFDHRFQVPSVLARRNISILPISRGDYVLSDIETFTDLVESPLPIIRKTMPAYIESLDFSTITSEAMALNCAYVSRILADFLGEEDLYPTVSGRMSSQEFGFEVARKSLDSSFLHVEVQNAQIEVDGGYEGGCSLALVEAKNSLSSDFLIRQLYYPYRAWKDRVNKVVRPVFFTYSNGIFHLREYKFEDPLCYNSISLVQERKYKLEEDSEEELNLEKVQEILQETPIVSEPEIPFPQANSFERVVSLCEILYNNPYIRYTKDELHHDFDFTQKNEFDLRQVDYYVNAAAYLGLVEKVRLGSGENYFQLTSVGNKLFGQRTINERLIGLIELIVAHKAFRETLILYLQRGEMPSSQEIVRIMKGSSLYNVSSENTYERRNSTIRAWVNWILSQLE